MNRLGRSAIRALSPLAGSAHVHWPVSGDVEVEVAGTALRLRAAADDALATSLFYGEEWEPHEARAWLKLLPKDEATVVDVGAHTGIYAVIAALARPQLRVVAVEPDPRNAKRLTENVSLNCAGRIEIVVKAVGEQSGMATLTLPIDQRISDASSLHRRFSEAHYELVYEQRQVALTTIDDLLGAAPRARVALIKIDVEGNELAALRGAERTVSRDRPNILCEVIDPELFCAARKRLTPADLPHERSEIEELLNSWAYVAYRVTPEGLLLVDSLRGEPFGIGNYVLSDYRSPERLIAWRAVSDTIAQPPGD